MKHVRFHAARETALLCMEARAVHVGLELRQFVQISCPCSWLAWETKGLERECWVWGVSKPILIEYRGSYVRFWSHIRDEWPGKAVCKECVFKTTRVRDHDSNGLVD
jgi:hypothetical protein